LGLEERTERGEGRIYEKGGKRGNLAWYKRKEKDREERGADIREEREFGLGQEERERIESTGRSLE
jgi:hypothetical protein